MKLIRHIQDRITGRVPAGKSRSSQWPAVERSFRKQYPHCEVCGGKKRLTVHHVVPFHLRPELELDPHNLITLCEGHGTFNCHLWIGHLGDFRARFNVFVADDAHYLFKRLDGLFP